ncbi:MAG: DUF3127 domain-containing protein [Chitinophagales bacterium]|nr:DUF3127 domain-containing protein [Chitinophagales bacterium]
MSFEVQGLLHKIFDTESKTETFQTREFVIRTEDQYPQFVKFQLVQDKCGVIDGFNADEKIKVFFDLRGREWQDKYFTNLQAWKVERLAVDGGFSTVPPPVKDDLPFDDPFSGNESAGGNNADFGDDLPF